MSNNREEFLAELYNVKENMDSLKEMESFCELLDACMAIKDFLIDDIYIDWSGAGTIRGTYKKFEIYANYSDHVDYSIRSTYVPEA